MSFNDDEMVIVKTYEDRNDLWELKEVLSKSRKVKKENGRTVLDGFEYITPYLIDCKLVNNSSDKIIAATSNGLLAGVCKIDGIDLGINGQITFYDFDIIETNRKFRHLGVGSLIMKHLDRSDFLQGNVLRMSSFLKDGANYLSKIIRRDMNPVGYSLLTHEVTPTLEHLKPGYYNENGVTDIDGFLEELSSTCQLA